MYDYKIVAKEVVTLLPSTVYLDFCNPDLIALFRNIDC